MALRTYGFPSIFSCTMKAKDAHHSGAAIIELDRLLASDGIGIPLGLLKMDFLNFLFASFKSHLNKSHEDDHLDNATNWYSLPSGKAGLNGAKWHTISNITRQTSSGSSDNMA